MQYGQGTVCSRGLSQFSYMYTYYIKRQDTAMGFLYYQNDLKSNFIRWIWARMWLVERGRVPVRDAGGGPALLRRLAYRPAIQPIKNVWLKQYKYHLISLNYCWFDFVHNWKYPVNVISIPLFNSTLDFLRLPRSRSWKCSWLAGTYHQIMDHQNSLKFPDDVEMSKVDF